jgi:3-oxoacyl-[acyl-carrier protein] reductase
MEFKGKNVLVTGSQQGIGKACALAFAKAGANVALHYLDDIQAVSDLCSNIQSMNLKSTILQADLSSAEQASALVERAAEALGPIDIVVNNAGIFRRSEFADLSVGLWDLTFDVNLRATALVCQSAVRAMRAAKIRGAIVNISSVATFGTAKGVHYSASKGGMDSLTRAIALDVARDGIRVNAVGPGMILTAQALEGNNIEELQKLAGQTVPGRLGSADEVASVVLFLASDAASFVNGEVIAVNGGAHMS